MRAIQQDVDGTLWFATDGGISRYDGKGFINQTAKDGLNDDSVWCLLKDR